MLTISSLGSLLGQSESLMATPTLIPFLQNNVKNLP